jgi:hypothetical protein
MAIEGPSQQSSPSGRNPWWIAAAGGGGSITAAVLQDHALGWAIVVAFIAWLIHNIAIAWIRRTPAAENGRRPICRRPICRSRTSNRKQAEDVNAADNRQRHGTA